MDGLPPNEISKEFEEIQKRISSTGRILINPYEANDHRQLTLNKDNAYLIVEDNKRNISQSDCVIVNLSIENHQYVGCIGEMIYAKNKGCFVIAVVGMSSYGKHAYTLAHADIIVKDMNQAFDIMEHGKR
jgi:nucleoside 2-deoxyribosyltransferase